MKSLNHDIPFVLSTRQAEELNVLIRPRGRLALEGGSACTGGSGSGG
jgi:hypothetical protein